MNYCVSYLTCKDEKEARKIADALLKKRLIACSKFVPISCRYWWQDKITDGKEILMIMETRQDLFSEIEKIVSELHSYETFVLETLPIENISVKAKTWLKTELAS